MEIHVYKIDSDVRSSTIAISKEKGRYWGIPHQTKEEVEVDFKYIMDGATSNGWGAPSTYKLTHLFSEEYIDYKTFCKNHPELFI